MKKAIAVVLMIWAGTVYAACTTHTYMLGDKLVVCQTCCYNGNCNTTCF